MGCKHQKQEPIRVQWMESCYDGLDGKLPRKVQKMYPQGTGILNRGLVRRGDQVYKSGDGSCSCQYWLKWMLGFGLMELRIGCS